MLGEDVGAQVLRIVVALLDEAAVSVLIKVFAVAVARHEHWVCRSVPMSGNAVACRLCTYRAGELMAIVACQWAGRRRRRVIASLSVGKKRATERRAALLRDVVGDDVRGALPCYTQNAAGQKP